MVKKGILERLKEGPIVGDGGMGFQLERRGYVNIGNFTPEAAVQHPEAVTELHSEFIRAGADVIQTFTFNATEGKLSFHGVDIKCADINQAAVEIAKGVTKDEDVLVCGGVNRTYTYLNGGSKEVVQGEFRKIIDIFVKEKVDFILAEFFSQIEELEWALEVIRPTGLPIAATMKLCPIRGDYTDVSPGECAVRMAKAGADIVGVNCGFDPNSCLKTIRLMKTALDKAGLKPFLMCQPLGYHCQEAENQVHGWTSLPEYPFALEPRLVTRWDARLFAREAYDLGVRYIGGCCGFEPYHIREIAEELAPERGRRPPAADKNGQWGDNLSGHHIVHLGDRLGKEYWSNLLPAAGRDIPRLSKWRHL